MSDHKNTLDIGAGDATDCRRAIWYRLKEFPKEPQATTFNRARWRAHSALKEVLREDMRENGWEFPEGPTTAPLPRVSNLINIGDGLNLISKDKYDVVSHPDHTGGQRVPLLMLILNHDRFSLSQHLGPRLAHPASAMRLAAHHRRYQDWYGNAPLVVTYDVNEHVWDHEQIPPDLILQQADIHLSPLRAHLADNVQEPPERDFGADSRQCQDCTFFSQCQEQTTASEVPPWTANNPPDELLAALENYQEAEAGLQTTEAFSKQRKQAKAVIETHMRAISDKTVELTTDLGKARITRVPGSHNSIDSKLARELLGERWKDVAITNEYVYARITLRKEKG